MLVRFIILDPGVFFINGNNNLVKKKCPIWFVPKPYSKPYLVKYLFEREKTPALFNNISIYLYFCLNYYTNSFIDSRSDKSNFINSKQWWSTYSYIFFIIASVFSLLRQAMITFFGFNFDR